MGCSPSKGKLSTAIYTHQDKALQSGSCESNCGWTEIKSQTETAIASGGQSLLQEENFIVQLQGKRFTVCDSVSGSVDIGETNVHSQEKLLTKESKDKNDRRMKENGFKRSRQRENLRKTVYMHSNVGLLQAQEAASAYMTHNIPKYESLLGLLEKATQTQLSLQPIVTLLTLQYEEINQVLDEIATEGEQMLEMHFNRVALPTAQNDVPLCPDIPDAERNSTEGSSDLLQHMLHDLIKKMRLIGDSVKRLGDTSLEETGDYFGSHSQLLAGKMGVKRDVELHLKQVLACVESYALRKLYSEDSALHSEDSGIGVENKFHDGPVICCSHQESSGSGASTQSSYGFPEGNLSCQACVNVDENDDVDKDIDAENTNNDEEPKYEQSDLTDQKMFSWSQEDPNQYPLQVKQHINKKSNNRTFEWSKQKDRNIRRPKTADDISVSCQSKQTPIHLWGAQRSQSADCLCRTVKYDTVQGKNRFPNDDQKPEWTTKRKNPSQFYCLQNGNNGQFKPGLTSSLTAFASVPPGKNAVKRLINTFSQGVCDNSNQKPLIGASRFRGKKKSFLPVLNNCRVGVSSIVNKNTNSHPLDVDVNSFPPPPPELLMDSFEKNEPHTSDEYGNETQNSRCYVSQSPGATRKTVAFLLGRDSISRDTLNILESCPNGQDTNDDSHLEKNCDQTNGDEDKEKNEAIVLFQHSQTINQMCHSTDILANLGPWDWDNKMSLPAGVGEIIGMGKRDSDEREASNFYSSSYPQTTLPVSREQLPPSSYSTCNRVPSPTPLPPSHSCPVNSQGETSRASFTFQIKRRTSRESNDENAFSSKSFYDARSVFCHENQSASQCVKPSCGSTLPRPWGESKISRERLQATCPPQTFRRSMLFRPTLTDHQLLLSSVREPHYQDSESTTLNNGR